MNDLPEATGMKKAEKKEKDKEIAVFTKNALEEVRIKLVTWEGKNYLDVRVWFNNNGNEFFPTKKGLTIGVEFVPKLLDALQKATVALKKAKDKT